MGPLVLGCGRRAAAVPSTAAALLVTAAAVLLLATGPDGAEGYPTYRLCGKHLADILELICKGRGFYDPFANAEPGKRVVAYVQTGRGVSDECCRQGCTRRTMESYCSAEPIHHKRPTPERNEPPGRTLKQRRDIWRTVLSRSEPSLRRTLGPRSSYRGPTCTLCPRNGDSTAEVVRAYRTPLRDQSRS